MQPNPTKARAHYARLAFQAATEAVAEALRDVLDSQPGCDRSARKRAGKALARFDAATIEMRDVILSEDSL